MIFFVFCPLVSIFKGLNLEKKKKVINLNSDRERDEKKDGIKKKGKRKKIINPLIHFILVKNLRIDLNQVNLKDVLFVNYSIKEKLILELYNVLIEGKKKRNNYLFNHK